MSKSVAAPAPAPGDYSEKIRGIGDKIVALTLVDAKELSDYLKIEHGIEPTAAGPQFVPPDPKEEKEKEEQTTFSVVIESFDPTKKIATIKAVRALTGLGLREAKEKVEAVPCLLQEDIAKDEAEQLAQQFRDAGCVVQIK